jgi:putative transcriptional regulator
VSIVVNLDKAYMELTNQFLIAMPILKDAVFAKCLIYITAHNTLSGAIGVIINKPVHVFEDKSAINSCQNINHEFIYLGGPVETDSNFILRQSQSANNQLELISEDNFQGFNKSDICITVGYSSWQFAQLESEIAQNYWLTLSASHNNSDMIFAAEPKDRYELAMKLLGIDNLSYLISYV